MYNTDEHDVRLGCLQTLIQGDDLRREYREGQDQIEI